MAGEVELEGEIRFFEANLPSLPPGDYKIAVTQTLKMGETVAVGYVDQSRDALQADRTVWEEISGADDEIELG